MDKELICVVGGGLLVIAALLAGANFLASKGCAAQWADSPFQSRYSFFGGCQIKTDDGKWIPSESYRELEP